MKKSIKLFILIVLTLFLGVNYVKAISNTLGPVRQVGSNVMDDCGYEKCYGMPLKAADTLPVICTEYKKTVPAGVTCTLSTGWDEKVRYGVAAIISSASSNINATAITNQYFAAELAINRFLNDKGETGAPITGTSLSSTYRTLYDNYLSVANSAYDSYASDSSVNITLSTSTLTFTLNGSNYESNSVTVSGVDSYNATTNVGSVSKSGNSFKVVVPVSSLNASTIVTATVTSSKTLNQARNYDCGDGYQALTPFTLDTVTKSDSESLSGTITPKAKIIINKVDGENKPLSGAKIQVTGPNNYSKTFTTNGESIVLENLEFGKYTITEIEAPAGYVVADSKTVTLSDTNLTSTVTLTDKKNKITISKLDITGKKELPGATLEVQNESGETLYKWVSTTTPYVIDGLSSGTYYLIETQAPTGYVINQEKIKFIITDKTVEEKVEMTNKLNIVKISKLNSADKQLLPGATLQIEDAEGNIVKYCTDEKGNTGVECIWTSTDKVYEIEGMPVGTYYLVETSSPEGFELNSNKIEFTVNGTDEIIEVIMENQLEVKVPDTLSSRSTLLLAIAMFDIALGIGIVTYVKKNKVEE